jgi:hypothetical protein
MPSIDSNLGIRLPIEQRPVGAHQARDPRKKTFLLGQLVHGNGVFTADCVVRDFSAGGAKITLAKRQVLPAELYLIVVKYGLACRSKLAWLSFPSRGLQFTDKYALETSLPEDLMFLRQLWLGRCERSGGVPVVEQWDAAQRTALSGSAF